MYVAASSSRAGRGPTVATRTPPCGAQQQAAAVGQLDHRVDLAQPTGRHHLRQHRPPGRLEQRDTEALEHREANQQGGGGRGRGQRVAEHGDRADDVGDRHDGGP
jgi:hypothetical protein